MTAPLIPAKVNLQDFPYMPFEFERLFRSDTWALSNDAEKVAAITLWGKSWAQEPTGSLPSDDRILASTNISGTGARWKRVKPMALRGWVLCDDGRYYHPIVCEKALEGWLEKLSKRLSSGAGNAKRWGVEFDPAEIEAHIAEARSFLLALNPDSRYLTRKRPPGLPTGSKKHPTGSPVGSPGHIPSGSQETGTRNIKQEQELSPPSSSARPSRASASNAPNDDDEGTVPGEQDLPSWIPKPLWREFFRHRAVIRKPLSIPGQRQVVARLVELSEAGHDIASSLRQTLAAGLAIPVTPRDPDHDRPGLQDRSRESTAERAARFAREGDERDAARAIGNG